jgi:hypothetical protein
LRELAGSRLPVDAWRRGYDWLRGSALGLVSLALLVGLVQAPARRCSGT